MTSSPLRRLRTGHECAPGIPNMKAAQFESLAKLVEDLIPTFKSAQERQFYKDVVRTYRAAARDAIRDAPR